MADSSETTIGAIRSIPMLLCTRFAQAARDVNDLNFQAPVATWKVYATDSNVASTVPNQKRAMGESKI